MNEKEINEYLTEGEGLRFFIDFRNGNYDDLKAKKVLNFLSKIEVNDDNDISRTLIMNVWSIPFHSMCYKDFAIEKGGDRKKIDLFIDEAIQIVKNIIDIKGFSSDYII